MSRNTTSGIAFLHSLRRLVLKHESNENNHRTFQFRFYHSPPLPFSVSLLPRRLALKHEPNEMVAFYLSLLSTHYSLPTPLSPTYNLLSTIHVTFFPPFPTYAFEKGDASNFPGTNDGIAGETTTLHGAV